MALIDLTDVVTDPDLSETFTIVRNEGEFAAGGWKVTRTFSFESVGVVTPATGQDMEQVPEADRVVGSMTFYSSIEILQTHDEGTSDIIQWNGDDYRVLTSWPFNNRGYWKAIAHRIRGK